MNGKQIRIERFETLPSTNDYAKTKLSQGEDLWIIARAQTGGRGTKGRSFSSKVGGVYLSKLSFYDDYPAKEAFKILQTAAVAVCETLSIWGVKAQIKWPNDILVRGKKICGILIENVFSGANVRSSIVGIGLNVCNELDEELLPIATTLCKETGKDVTVADVEKVLMQKLGEMDIWEKYADYLGFMGEEVTLLLGTQRVPAIPIKVDKDGNLIAKTAMGEEKFSFAEVSLRGNV